MKVNICMGTRCTLMGANNIYDAVEYIKEDLCGPDSKFCTSEEIDLEISHCMGYCKSKKEGQGQVAPVVKIDDEIIFKATAQEISEKIINTLKDRI